MSEQAPGYVRGYVIRCMGRKRDNWHSPMDVFMSYCLTPPVYPIWERTPDPYYKKMPLGPVVARECIVCGRVHVTSEECPIPAPREYGSRDSVPRRHDGYTLQRARNMGALED